jgi:hypothetical protein
MMDYFNLQQRLISLGPYDVLVIFKVGLLTSCRYFTNNDHQRFKIYHFNE